MPRQRQSGKRIIPTERYKKRRLEAAGWKVTTLGCSTFPTVLNARFGTDTRAASSQRVPDSTASIGLTATGLQAQSRAMRVSYCWPLTLLAGFSLVQAASFPQIAFERYLSPTNFQGETREIKAMVESGDGGYVLGLQSKSPVLGCPGSTNFPPPPTGSRLSRLTRILSPFSRPPMAGSAGCCTIL